MSGGGTYDSSPTIATTVVAARECAGRLEDDGWLLCGMREAVAAAGGREHGAARAQYVPHGITAVVFLAESHVLVSTWPEFAFAYVEIALCGSRVFGRDLWAELRSLLRPGQEDVHELQVPVAAGATKRLSPAA